MAHSFAPYRKLLKRARDIALFTTSAELLSWDQETGMPPKALPYRGEQLAGLSGLAHRLFTAPKVGEWLAACEQHGFAPDSDEAVNVRGWRHDYDRATKIPARLVEKLERVRTRAREAWTQARAQSNFPLFRPHLVKMLELQRQFADCWGYAASPYDALLEGYEPGARTADLQVLFAELQPALAAILGPAVERSRAVPAGFLRGDYPIAGQQAFNREVAAAMGFDFEAGRIDTTTHPFCTSPGPRDSRLTTRYDATDFTQSLYGIMHEAGHGLYDQGLPEEHHGTPRGSFVSLGIHESQSRLWENHVGRSPAFWQHWHAIACRHLPDLRRFTPEQVTAAVNRVAPSLIRVAADPVTYDLHILLRFDLEVRLVEGQLAVADVPAYWNEQFEQRFGLPVPRDAVGCLQDIHWSLGSIGYFPTYTLGNLNAAQLMHRAQSDHPSLAAELAAGNYATLLGWLRDRVHQHGRRYRAHELMQVATGAPTGSAAHFAYLQGRYVAG